MKRLTQAHRDNISKALLGRSFSEEHRASLSSRVITKEWKSRLSASAKGRRVSPEARLKMSLSRKGKNLGADNPSFGRPVSAETRAKLSAAGKRQPPRTEAQKEKLANYNRTRVLTEETKKRMSESLKTAWSSPELRKQHSEAMKRAWKRDDGTMKRAVSAAVSRSLRGRILLGSRGRLCSYKGVNLKSLIELESATDFDLKGWKWEYEPFVVSDNLGSMVPDFLVHDGTQELIYEVGESGEKFGKLLRLALATGLVVRGIGRRTRRRVNKRPSPGCEARERE